jgi:uncharacterized protein
VGDLKGKRRQIASLKSQLHGRLGAAVAEVDHQDRWQRATIAVALTGGSLAELERAADRVERFVGNRHPEGSWCERRIASSNDFEALA